MIFNSMNIHEFNAYMNGIIKDVNENLEKYLEKDGQVSMDKVLEGTGLKWEYGELKFNTLNIDKEKCEYCREKSTGYQNGDLCDVPINLFNGRSLGRMTLYINEKDRLSMDLYNSYDDPLITCDIGIHYCPMCGRRLQ